MTFYQELQLDAAGSKKQIAAATRKRDKVRHSAIFTLKVFLNLVFSVAFVSIFSWLFGAENALTGVVVLLCVMAFRAADLDISAKQSVGVIYLLYAIFAFMPKLANLLPLGGGFAINLLGIFLIVFFGCHNSKKCNHFILVLSYILLLGSDVSGVGYYKRLLGLLVGAILTTIIFYCKHRKQQFNGGFTRLFKEFRLSNEDTRWQIKFTLCVSTALLVGAWLKLPKYTWVGIAAMSVSFPIRGRIEYRTLYRIVGNMCGCLLFAVLFYLLPASMVSYFGLVGGFCLGFCALYGWQSMFNAFSALSMAAGIFGAGTAIIFRFVNNAVGAIYALIFDLACEPILLWLNKLLHHKRKAPRQHKGNLPIVVAENLHPYELLLREYYDAVADKKAS